jgi:hypothetical protein
MAPLAEVVDLVVADGGSTDGSTTEAELASRGVTALLTKTGPGKLSAQMRMAFAWALDQGYEGVITIDGNGKDDTSAVPAFAPRSTGLRPPAGQPLRAGRTGDPHAAGRYLGIRLLHAPLISLAAGRRYTDTTNGFRAYSARFSRTRGWRRSATCSPPTSSTTISRSARPASASAWRSCRDPHLSGLGPTPTIHGLRGNLFVLRTLAACRPLRSARHGGWRMRRRALIGVTGFVGGNLQRQLG